VDELHRENGFALARAREDQPEQSLANRANKHRVRFEKVYPAEYCALCDKFWRLLAYLTD
jgi:hypothetical protein